MVAETPILPAHIEDTVQAIAKLHADHHLEAGKLQRFVERLRACCEIAGVGVIDG